MKIQVFSDTHIEHHKDDGEAFFASLRPQNIDVLVVAGDLTSYNRLDIDLPRLCKMYPRVVYVMGNHEFYYSSPKDTIRKVRAIEKETPNLSVLEQGSVVIDGQRFIGGTLWFYRKDVPPGAESQLPDFSATFEDFDIFTAFVYSMGASTRKFLSTNVRPDDIVVTHMMPSYNLVHRRYLGSAINCFFVNDMNSLLCSPNAPKVWINGHTHSAYDRQDLGPTRFICNPFGYPGESHSDPNFVFEV